MGRREEILRARSEASRALVSLNVDTSKAIDVFGCIRRAGLWLVFNKFDGLLGAMSREGAGGIAINPERPLGMQRYTAAHELGHWYLHEDAVVWDSEEESPNPTDLREVGAQEFAAAFLMPRKLVQHTLRGLGIGRGDTVDALTAYMASRNLGVSYTGFLIQLVRMKVITEHQRAALASRSPASLKKALNGGQPVGRNSQVWNPEGPELESLVITVGDQVAVSLPENRTTGFRWHVDGNSNGASVPVIADQFVRGDGARVGQPGERHLLFQAETEGAWNESLALVRPFEKNKPPVDEVRLNAQVLLTPERVSAAIIASPPTAVR